MVTMDLENGNQLLSKPPRREVSILGLVAASTLLAAVLGAGIAVCAMIGAGYKKDTGGASVVCANLCRLSNWTMCELKCDASRRNAVRPSALGGYINFEDAIQHVGITTSNLTRSVEFYTNIMGGVEVLKAGGDGWKGDDVYQLLMQAALVKGGVAETWAANISAHGPESMSARYVAFDSMVIELLDYFSEEAALQRSLAKEQIADQLAHDGPFPTFSPTTRLAPSVAWNMHIAFHVRSDVDPNDFVEELERQSHAAGFDNVLCNRKVPVPVGADGKADVSNTPKTADSYLVDSGGFKGWSLSYCKGPDGEQLEFNRVKDAAYEDFTTAHQVYLRGGSNPLW